MTSPAPTALSLTRDLIRCASVTPAEGGALALLDGVLKAAGFETHRVTFSAPGTPDIDNLYARIGAGAPHLTFAGHTDVVPPGERAAWRHDPFAGEIADGAIYGRGACDMKGAAATAAATLTAALTHLRAHGAPKGSMSFLLTGDEEGPAVNGTVKLLAWARDRGERFDHCILGEPTNPDTLGETIKIGRRGSLSGRIVVHGRQGHVGYPHLADNPIPHIVRMLAALKAPALDQGTPHFDASNLEVTSVDVGNPADNVIPGEAAARFNIRFNDLWTPQTLSGEISKRVAASAGEARYTLTFQPTNAVAFLTKPGPFTELVARAVTAETGVTPAYSTTGGTSDARFIKDCCPVVEFGLVGQTMHMADERASVADIEALARIYGRVIADYFGA
jgi:succinyl-diaminopimelate desuccinylase